MPKYYCDYCKSYLTHDTLSVRKSHLQGRNHIKLYCDYYELKAKETNLWNPSDVIYDITLDKINTYENSLKSSKHNNSTDVDAMDIDKNNDTNDKSINQNFDENEDDDGDDAIFLPPPPSLIGLPNPPPAVYNNTKQYQKAIFNHTHKKSV
ncbi:U1 small nuclear ribonucleoprotein C [Candida tropicalis]